MDSFKYLIIGGSTKCGTTSVFNYFEYHPQICPCVMKESRYFWNDEYPLTAAARKNETIKNFSALFRNCSPSQVMLEATPDYLYSKKSAARITKELNDCKIIFILRDPLTRLISWYRFAMLNGLISKDITFEMYVNMQKENTNSNPPQHLRALDQGNYSVHLEHYISIFGKEKVLVTFYEDLEKDPLKFCVGIANFAHIDPQYFEKFDFKIYNQTVSAKSVTAHKLFRTFRRTVRPLTRLFNTSIRKKLKLAGQSVEESYMYANKSGNKSVNISEELKSYLREFYREDKIKVKQLTGINPPWQH